MFNKLFTLNSVSSQSKELKNQTISSTIEIMTLLRKSIKDCHYSRLVIWGAIAQLVEHLHGMQGVSGSSPWLHKYFF